MVALSGSFLMTQITYWTSNIRKKISSVPQKYQLLSSGVCKDTDLVRLVYWADHVNSRSRDLRNGVFAV